MARTKQTARISTQGKDPARFPDIPKSVLAAGRGQKKQTEAYVPKSVSSKIRMKDEKFRKERIAKARKAKKKMMKGAAKARVPRHQGGVGYKRIVEQDVEEKEITKRRFVDLSSHKNELKRAGMCLWNTTRQKDVDFVDISSHKNELKRAGMCLWSTTRQKKMILASWQSFTCTLLICRRMMEGSNETVRDPDVVAEGAANVRYVQLIIIKCD